MDFQGGLVRRQSFQMEPMSPSRPSILGPLTRSEEILQFERLRHQISMVQAMRGLQISPAPRRPVDCSTLRPWRRLREVKFSELGMDIVQEGCIIKCRTVVVPLVFGSVQLLVEEMDGGGKVTMLSIDNYIDEARAMEIGTMFPVGRELWIRNPCVRSHAGRPMIHVDDPFNLKLRPSIWEIERILDYGPVDAEGWKIKGNVLVERGRLEEAADAYGMGIDYAGGNQRLKGKLHRKRASTFVAMGKYQRARREAIQSLAIQATDKTRLLLARILVRLRSYSAALEFLQQIGDRDENEVETLIGQLSTCVTEQRDGTYDLVAITEEAKRDDRVLHADYVSPIVELREEGVAGRGLFANEDIADGTLLIASKAVLCVFSHEMAKESGNLGDAPRTFDSVRATLAERLTQVIENGNARRVLGLTGGLYSTSSKLDLRKDDVFDYDDMQFDVSEVKDIIAKNSFALSSQKNTPAPPADENPLGNVGGAGGGALFYVPAFLNHSCVPNASYFTIGDMMFVKTNRDVERGEELTVHYLFVERSAERDRNETLEKVWDFTCQCELCEYERENEETCLAADTIVSDALELAEVSKSDDAISELQSARKKLYELCKTPLPPVYAFTMLQSPPANPPASLARHLVVVQKELKRLARDTSPDESLNAAVNGAYHFLLKAYPHFGRIGSVGEAALRVWEYFVNNPEDSEPETAEAWLTEATETHDKQLGAGFFEYQYGKFVSAVQA